VIELTHTIDALQRAGRQIVLAADRAPAELKSLGPELGNRLTSGLVCRLESPDLPTRLGIVTQVAANLGLALADDVRQFVATTFSAHARELVGALKRLVVAVRMHEGPLDLQAAQEALDELMRSRRKTVRLADIERAVCTVFDLEADALQSPRKGNDVSRPRMLAMWLARKYTRAALSEIGGFFGGRSHSTVISAHKKVDAWLSSGEPLQLGFGRCRFDEAMRKVEETLLGAAG
jgi:chromosomal replication initiator protein